MLNYLRGIVKFKMRLILFLATTTSTTTRRPTTTTTTEPTTPEYGYEGKSLSNGKFQLCQ